MTITMYPVIVPTAPNAHSDTSLVQECIEEDGNSDILKKYIAQEQLSEEEENRIVECVEDKKATEHVVAGVVIAIIALVFLAVIAFAVWSFMAVR